MRRTAATLAAAAFLVAGCAQTEPTIRIHGVMTAHPENDCRFATSGKIRPGLAGIRIEFTDLASHRTFATRTDARSVRVTRSPCFESASYAISVPSAERYVVRVDYFPAFGGPPEPTSITLDRLRRGRFRLDLVADPSTGE